MNIVQVKKYYLPVKAKVNQSIEETKFTYPPLGKIFEKKKKMKDAAEKQRGTIEEAAEKQKKYLQTLNTDQQLQLIDDLFTKNFLTTEAKDELA